MKLFSKSKKQEKEAPKDPYALYKKYWYQFDSIPYNKELSLEEKYAACDALMEKIYNDPNLKYGYKRLYFKCRATRNKLYNTACEIVVIDDDASNGSQNLGDAENLVIDDTSNGSQNLGAIEYLVVDDKSQKTPDDNEEYLIND